MFEIKKRHVPRPRDPKRCCPKCGELLKRTLTMGHETERHSGVDVEIPTRLWKCSAKNCTYTKWVREN